MYSHIGAVVPPTLQLWWYFFPVHQYHPARQLTAGGLLFCKSCWGCDVPVTSASGAADCLTKQWEPLLGSLVAFTVLALRDQAQSRGVNVYCPMVVMPSAATDSPGSTNVTYS